MIRIYHVTGTRGTRLIWLCEELGLEYEVEKIDFSPSYRSSPEWRALNPVGKVPVLSDDGKTMFESGAMLQYVMDRYAPGQLRPAIDDDSYAIYLQWFWFAEATLARPLGEIVNHRRAFAEAQRVAAVVAEMGARGESCLLAVADHLQGKQYLSGEQFTAADIMMGYSIMLAEAVIPELIPNHLQAYWQLLQSRPAFVSAKAY